MQNPAKNEEKLLDPDEVFETLGVNFIQPQMATANPERETDSDTDIAVDDETDLEPPYRVLIHNDNITTFVFVIKILTTIFEKNVMSAEQIANRTHRHGIAVVGTYPRSIAETRINKVHFAAQLEGYPLKLTMEAAE